MSGSGKECVYEVYKLVETKCYLIWLISNHPQIMLQVWRLLKQL